METTQGTMETDDVVEGAPLWVKEAEKQTEKIKAKMSPPGFLQHELLDLRRRQFGIPDSAWRVQAAFNTVFVHQIHDIMFEKGTWGDSGLVIPESVQQSRKKAAPRGIIVSAGLQALDALKSHGMDLGHIVTLVRFAPFRVEYDYVGGEFFYLLDLHVSDIHGSEDTATALRERRIAMVSEKLPNGGITHMYRGADGVTISPSNPGATE